jgi:hypothetical protein
MSRKMKFLSDQEAKLVLQALKDGRTVWEISRGRRGSQLASYETFQRYCSSHPDFDREARAHADRNGKIAQFRKGASKRDKTHCRRGHPLSGDNLYLDLGRYRRCKACTVLNGKNPPAPTEDQIKCVTAALNAGQTLTQICAGRLDGKRVGARIIGFNKLKVLREQNPDFNRFVCAVSPGNLARARQRRRNPQEFHANIHRAETNDYHRIVELVPANLPPDMRDDIVQSIFLALLEGTLRRDQIRERVRHFVTAHNREANKNGIGKFGLISLDAPIFADSSATLGDSITRGLWD